MQQAHHPHKLMKAAESTETWWDRIATQQSDSERTCSDMKARGEISFHVRSTSQLPRSNPVAKLAPKNSQFQDSRGDVDREFSAESL